MEEGQRVVELPELRRCRALEDALQPERLELVAIRQNLRKRPRVCWEDALEVKVREIANRDGFGRERPIGVVKGEVADGGLVLLEEVEDLRRRTARRVVGELHNVLEAREPQLACPVGRPGYAEAAAVSALLPPPESGTWERDVHERQPGHTVADGLQDPEE